MTNNTLHSAAKLKLLRNAQLMTLIALLLMASPSIVVTRAHAADQASIPITIEADQAILKEKQGYSLYHGNVVFKQGDMQFLADEVKVESKNGKLDVMTATGNPVTFKQGLKQQEPISAQAQSIQYFAIRQKILLTENALLTQGSNCFTGNRIEYNVKTETVIAGGNTGNPDRVKIVIQAKNPSTGSKCKP